MRKIEGGHDTGSAVFAPIISATGLNWLGSFGRSAGGCERRRDGRELVGQLGALAEHRLGGIALQDVLARDAVQPAEAVAHHQPLRPDVLDAAA